MVQISRTTGEADLTKIDRAQPAALLGVRFDDANFDPLSVQATAAGRRWNVDGWWLATWSADAASVTTVLARDENGGAAMWVKRYGGPEGTGFVEMKMPAVASEPSPH
jgi:hypothetical protein